MSKYKSFNVGRVIEALDELDEIGGPDSFEDYIQVLEKVKKEIEERISIAEAQLEAQNE